MTAIEEIQDARWDSQLVQMGAELAGADDDVVGQVRAWSEGMRGDFASTLRCTDAGEHPQLIAAAWVQVRAQWHVLNIRIGYEIAESGEAKPETVLKATTLAMLSDCFEAHLEGDAAQHLAEFVGNQWTPVGAA